jgi:hypothetical protein
MASKIKGSSLTIIPAAGHSSTIENADFVTRHLEEFIGSLKVTPTMSQRADQPHQMSPKNTVQ